MKKKIEESEIKRSPLKHSRLKVVSVILLALVCYSLPFLFSDEVISPDDFIYSFFSTQLARTGQLGYLPAGDEIFGVEGFIPRYFVYNREGQTLPRKFPGFILFWAGLKRLMPEGLSRLVNPFCAMLCLIFLYFIARLLLPDLRGALRAIIILATTPVFVRRAYAYNPTLFNLAVFLAALYLLLSALQEGACISYCFFGLSAGYLLWIRPTNVIYLLSFLILIFLERKKVKLNFLLISLLLLVLIGGGLLYYNHEFYGGYFNLGYTATSRISEAAPGAKVPLSIRRIADYLHFHPRIWLFHLKNLPLALGLAFPLIVISLIGFFAPPGNEKTFRFRFFYLWLFVIAVAFFSNFGTFGSEKGELTLHSSFLRYLVPVICLLPIFAARALSRFSFPGGRLLGLMVAVNLIVTLAAPAGVIETVMQSRYYRECRRFLLRESPEKSVIFTFYWDKVVFPERLVYTNGLQSPKGDIYRVIDRVHGKGYQVIYPASHTDRLIAEELLDHYQVEEIEGPIPISPLARLAAGFIPDDLYPLRLYKVTGPKLGTK